MKTLILKLTVAVIPLIVLIASVTSIYKLSFWYTHHPLSWHRKRRNLLRALAAGVVMH